MRLINPNLERNNVPVIRFVLACLAAGCILIPPHSAIIHHPAPGHSPSPDNHDNDNNSLSCKPPTARILKHQVWVLFWQFLSNSWERVDCRQWNFYFSDCKKLDDYLFSSGHSLIKTFLPWEQRRCKKILSLSKKVQQLLMRQEEIIISIVLW